MARVVRRNKKHIHRRPAPSSLSSRTRGVTRRALAKEAMMGAPRVRTGTCLPRHAPLRPLALALLPPSNGQRNDVSSPPLPQRRRVSTNSRRHSRAASVTGRGPDAPGSPHRHCGVRAQGHHGNPRPPTCRAPSPLGPDGPYPQSMTSTKRRTDGCLTNGSLKAQRAYLNFFRPRALTSSNQPSTNRVLCRGPPAPSS